MNQPKTHEEKWQHNRDFLRTIPEAYSDWIVSVAFYAAVHCVETLFKHDKLAPATSHDVRNGILRKTARYKHIWKHYRILWDGSIAARYYIGETPWISAQDAKTRFAGQHLHEIEKSVCKLTKRPPPDRIEWLG